MQGPNEWSSFFGFSLLSTLIWPAFPHADTHTHIHREKHKYAYTRARRPPQAHLSTGWQACMEDFYASMVTCDCYLNTHLHTLTHKQYRSMPPRLSPAPSGKQAARPSIRTHTARTHSVSLGQDAGFFGRMCEGLEGIPLGHPLSLLPQVVRPSRSCGSSTTSLPLEFLHRRSLPRARTPRTTRTPPRTRPRAPALIPIGYTHRDADKPART
jgi:hypothetical protein